MTRLGNGIGKTSYVESCLCIAFTLSEIAQSLGITVRSGGAKIHKTCD